MIVLPTYLWRYDDDAEPQQQGRPPTAIGELQDELRAKFEANPWLAQHAFIEQSLPPARVCRSDESHVRAASDNRLARICTTISKSSGGHREVSDEKKQASDDLEIVVHDLEIVVYMIGIGR
jgi:hypothetical protein